MATSLLLLSAAAISGDFYSLPVRAESLPVERAVPPVPIPLLPAGVTLERVILEGSTVLTPEQVEAAAADYIGHNVTLEDLRAIQLRLNALYQSAGYATSLVQFLSRDNQRLEAGEGVVVYRALEAKLERLDLEGLTHLRESYVRDRLVSYATTPLKLSRLEEGLLLLQQEALVETIQAELLPGSQPGRNVWRVRVAEAPTWQIAGEGSNDENPAVGEWGAKVLLENRNLFGRGEGAKLEYKQTEGLARFLATALIPLNPQGGTVQLSYQQVDSRIVSEPFAPLDIRNDSYTAAASFQQPLLRTLTDRFSLGLSVEQRQSQSYLFGNFPFSFAPEVRDGRTELTAVRFQQTYWTQDSDSALWVNSQLSGGWSNLTGTSSFFSWQGQLQYHYAVSDSIRLSARLAAQLSPERLPALEQCAIGGLNGNQFIFGNTVRGYTTNVRSGDNCLAASVEAWFTLASERDWGRLSLVPFVDFGTVWDDSGSAPQPNTLVSTGLGLRWQVGEVLSLRLDYGIPLKAVVNSELEEQRWNFSLFLGTRF